MHDLATQIFGVPFPPPTPVPTPEWPAVDGKVFVMALSAADRDRYEAGLRDDDNEPDLENVRGRLVAFAACDSAGVRLFSDDDAERVGRLPAGVVFRLWDAARRAAGMYTEDERGTVGTLAKNSSATGGEDSPSS